ncbi:MAG: class I SAM-dependent methyltransferase [Alphaproteobacteria bacterium]|nr:class I SAM-dependent methyltransferase [Alphaproteobacteria bacterium]MBU1516831.1 class I SAM-dependent methyltransferase [Alphaproteobacteria bacterium]MBU2092525.1 class I SAM-dependent methyltransferase [Alphaproteobacteria bacterium]MBU2151363.1 class I SAM-dependent methyltransferase [Alphaproteobacteria bacterium]MBU2309666.1 class I SAM-dependent methyltransferase [Alphaproteobacteria bacterium]
MRAIEHQHWWFRARRKILADQLSRLKLPANASILEVGCGPGGNLAMLSRFGKVVAIEPDAESRRYAAESTGVTVLDGGLPDGLPTFDKPFDLIAALDVIEHLDQDAASLVALRKLLAPGGVLFTTVPAHPWLWSRHDELHHHKRRYRREAYVALLKSAGFDVQRVTFFNAVLFPMIALARAVKLGERSGRADDSLPSKPVNAILEGAFGSEAFMLRHVNLPFGVSILAVARPRADAAPAL